MKATAQLVVERDTSGRSVVREFRCQPPIRLVPRRGAARDGAVVVHLVNTAATPLGGDETDLRIQVGAGARLRLRGIAASVVLPGQDRGGSHATVHIEVAEGGTVEYLPEPAVVTARAQHHVDLDVRLGAHARMRCRDTVVLGRDGEPCGSLRTMTSIVRERTPLLRQELAIDSHPPATRPAHLASARVLATETVVWENDIGEAVSQPWWSLVPLAAGGALA